MVEPFGCVVMLHWRLHVYGGPVPLPATPSSPSPLFTLPWAMLYAHLFALLSSPSPLLLQCIPWPACTTQPSTNSRQSVETECYHWPMCHYCTPAVWQLHNSYWCGQCYNYVFLYIPREYCSPIWSPFIKTTVSDSSVPQSKEHRWPILWSHRDQK